MSIEYRRDEHGDLACIDRENHLYKWVIVYMGIFEDNDEVSDLWQPLSWIGNEIDEWELVPTKEAEAEIFLYKI
jgi:hypothetical protein